MPDPIAIAPDLTWLDAARDRIRRALSLDAPGTYYTGPNPGRGYFDAPQDGAPASFPERTLIVVPDETPRENIKNALTLLSLIEQINPAVWHFTPDLARAVDRAEAALLLLETPAHYPPIAHAQEALRGAVRALLAAPVEWDVLPDVRAACARLLAALFQLEA